jgi:hypothetical protein
MALKDVQTNKNELQEYLLLIAKVPEKVDKIDIDIKKELLIDIDNRISSISETICGLISNNKNYKYPENYLPDKLFDYWALKVSQLFTYNELKSLKDWIESSIKQSNVNTENKELEVKEPEAININPYPLLFINFEVYKCFLEYTKKHIIDFYGDYSYLKKRLEVEKLIHYHKDTDFLNIIFNKMQLIKQYEYDSYFTKYDSKFQSIKRCSNDQRENNFNNIFKNLI